MMVIGTMLADGQVTISLPKEPAAASCCCEAGTAGDVRSALNQL